MTSASDTHLYTLHFSSLPDDTFLADYCPAGTILTISENTFTLANLRADQAGVLGIIRRLHNEGCILFELEIKNGELP